jgi:hypothetical protein
LTPSLKNKDVCGVRILFYIFMVYLLGSCGSNTNTPVVPFVFLTPPAVPQVVGILPIYEVFVPTSEVIDGLADKINYKPQFVLKYFVNNREQNFTGYNLTITTATPSLADTQLGASVYTENGILPSFPHTAIEASTEAANLKRRTIANRIAPPGMIPFTHCESYTFTLRAVFNSGVISNPSVPIAACASVYPSKCPVGSSCNTSTCANASCTATEKKSCSVGTLCNPCTVSGKEGNGCECPAGSSPPGCNP